MPEKKVGHVIDVIEPRRPKHDGVRFFGFIVSDENEKLYFECHNLRSTWNQPATSLVNKIVTFEPVDTPPHAMRQAMNIDIISGAAA